MKIPSKNQDNSMCTWSSFFKPNYIVHFNITIVQTKLTSAHAIDCDTIMINDNKYTKNKIIDEVER